MKISSEPNSKGNILKKRSFPKSVVLGSLAGAVIVAVAYLAYLSHKQYKETVISQTQHQLLMTARSIATGIEAYVEEHLHVLKVISRNPGIQKNAYAGILEHAPTQHCVCEDLYEAHKEHVDALTILDAKGVMLRRHPYWAERIGRDHTDKPGVEYVLRNHKPHVSNIFYNNYGRLAISVSEPIFYDDKFAGMVRWMIEIDRISQRFIESVELSKEGRAWMFDDEDTILIHPRKEFGGVPVLDFMRAMHTETGTVFDESSLEAHIREEHDYLNKVKVEEEGYGMFIGCITGQDELTAYKRVAIGDRSWHLIVGLPYSQIVGPISDHARNTFGLAALAILVFAVGGAALVKVQKRKAKLESDARYLKRIAESARALRESEEKLAGIVHSVTDVMIMLDEQFNVVWVNDVAETMFQPNLVGSKCYSAYHRRDRICDPCIVKQCFEDGKVHEFETAIIDPNGNKMAFWCTASVAAWGENGRPKMVVEFLKDITDLKQTQETLQIALRKAEDERLKSESIVEGLGEALGIIDTDFRFVYQNKVHRDSYGEHIGELCYKAIKNTNEICEGCQLAESFRDGKIHTKERVVPRQDGEIFVVNTASPLRDSTGNIIAGIEIVRDITEIKEAEKQVKASLREKEVLLKELHHRVKNNLQIISGLLKLQSGFVEDETSAHMFKESQDRVTSMALVHEKLYQSENLASIDLNDYVNHVVTALFRSYAVDTGRVALKIRVSDVALTVDRAIPCGLIINELVSNALKYAFPEGKEGEVSITVRSGDGDEMELVVSDNGVGMSDDLDIANVHSLGLKLVRILTDQLGGTLEIDRSRGTKFQIRFKK